jgi:DNA-binding CsgD family transcriptional regulator/nucleoside 2-deoxyribosyltransferase
MPITTPTELVKQYKDDADHFGHVLEHLFIPVLEEAGFDPIPPTAEGSNIIQADIIKQLSSCELVLCDISILNPNVFFEFGIRTALDKPVALVRDNKTTSIPFHPSSLHCHEYDSSLAPWTLEEQKKKLAKHIQDAYKKSNNRNALWKYFGVAQIGTFKPEDAELGEKMDLMMGKLSTIERQQERIDTRDFTFQKVKGTYEDMPMISLTSTEMELLDLIFNGKSTSEIAELLHRSTRTVEVHRSRIMKKFGVDNTAGLIRRAVQLGLVDF